MSTSFTEATRILELLGYRYVGQSNGCMGWAKREGTDLVITVGYKVGQRLENIGRFQMTVQNDALTQIISLDKQTNEDICQRLVQLECALLNGIESLRQDL